MKSDIGENKNSNALNEEESMKEKQNMSEEKECMKLLRTRYSAPAFSSFKYFGGYGYVC